MKQRIRQCGVALIIVLWIIILLSLIAASFVYTMRTDVQIVSNATALAKARAAADAAVQRAVFDMFKPPQDPDRWNPDGTTHDWTFGDASVKVTVLDESGKIDINTASEALLRSLLVAEGQDDDAASALTDALIDWRDSDALKRLHGAEEAEYKAAGLNYKPANVAFQAVEELRLVLGMSAALYQRLAPLITIYSRLPGLNSQIASRQALLALPNITAAQVDDYLQVREQARTNKQPVPLFVAASQYLSLGSGFLVSIHATATLADGTGFVREVVVARAGNPKRPYTFLSWKEGVYALAGMPGNTIETHLLTAN